MKTIHIGENTFLCLVKIVAILPAQGWHMQRLRDEKYAKGALISAKGKLRCRSMVLCEGGELFLSSLSTAEMNQRLQEEI